MKCMTNELLSILPHRLRSSLDIDTIRLLRDIRLRIGLPVRLCYSKHTQLLDLITTKDDISHIIHNASRYSPWSASTIADGYLTAPGGHRIGVCGDAVLEAGTLRGIRTPSSICIRIAKDIPGCAKLQSPNDSLLILGPPGSGKTTLLRDIIRQLSNDGTGAIAVVDERGEVFPKIDGVSCFDPGANTDIMQGAGKGEGIDMILRAMGPKWIAVDEISSRKDCVALLQAGWCGVKLLATAHAGSLDDLRHRPIYRPLMETRLFSNFIIMNPDNSYRLERVVS